MRLFDVFVILVFVLGIFAVVPFASAVDGPCDKLLQCGRWGTSFRYWDYPTPAGYFCNGLEYGGIFYKGFAIKTCTSNADCALLAQPPSTDPNVVGGLGCAVYGEYKDTCADCMTPADSQAGYECKQGKCVYVEKNYCWEPDPSNVHNGGWPLFCCAVFTGAQDPNSQPWWVKRNSVNGVVASTLRQFCCLYNAVPANPASPIGLPSPPYSWGRKECPKAGEVLQKDIQCGTTEISCNEPQAPAGTYDSGCTRDCQFGKKKRCSCAEGACGKHLDNCPGISNPTQRDTDGDGMGDECDPCKEDPTNLCNSNKEGSGLMSAASGGRITTGDGNAELAAGPGAVPAGSSPLSISIVPGELAGSVVVTSLGLVLRDYHIIPSGFVFDEPLNFTIKYEQGSMAECGEQEQLIDIYMYDINSWLLTENETDATSLWVAQNGIVDCANNKVTIQLMSLSINDYDGYSEYAAIAPLDADYDGVFDDWGGEKDNCPNVSNTDQVNLDNDTIGDVCDSDIDGDGVINVADFCPTLWTVSQGDVDGDGMGDECDSDADNDGILNENDCGPFEADSYAGAPEICDGKDNNCDGTVDEGLTSATSCGVGECAAVGQMVCVNGSETNTCEPGMPIPESCEDNTGYDGLDNNCDGTVDLNCGSYCDKDGDGYTTHLICVFMGKMLGDCDDNNAAVHPGATEVCNDGSDNNCNGQVDEGCGLVPADEKKNLVISLSALKPSESEAKKQLVYAIGEINQSLGNLNLKYGDKDIVWLDSSHILCKHGDKAFEHEKKAVSHLQKAFAATKNSAIKTALTNAINTIVAVDRTLAQTAITQAQALVASGKMKQSDVDKANAALIKGDAATKLTDKIEHYKKAWKYVNKHCLIEPNTCIESITVKSPKGEIVTATGDEVSSLSTLETLFVDNINNVQVKIQTSCSKCIKVGQSFSSWIVQEIIYKPGFEGNMTKVCGTR